MDNSILSGMSSADAMAPAEGAPAEETMETPEEESEEMGEAVDKKSQKALDKIDPKTILAYLKQQALIDDDVMLKGEEEPEEMDEEEGMPEAEGGMGGMSLSDVLGGGAPPAGQMV